MIKEALKEALLDLKKQLRGKKASAYLTKEEVKEAKVAKKNRDEDEEEEDDVKPKAKAKPTEVSEKVSEGMDDLQEQMKAFMGKRKTTGPARPGIPLPMNAKKPDMKAKAPAPAKAKEAK